ncbi:hypothetical protein SLA2020_503380 [Shorea laevis]
MDSFPKQNFPSKSMATTKSCEEATLPTKCKAQDHDNSPLKAPKIVPQDEIEDNEETETSKSNNLGTPVPESKTSDQEPEVDVKEDEDGDYVEEDEDDDEGDAQVDKKGKGILIKEEEDDKDDDNDSSDGEHDESNANNDLSDDPLAEVDLENGGFIVVSERRECRGNTCTSAEFNCSLFM